MLAFLYALAIDNPAQPAHLIGPAQTKARVFVVITFLTFGEAQIIGGIVPNLIAFVLFLGGIGYFASTGKMAEMFGWKNKK